MSELSADEKALIDGMKEELENGVKRLNMEKHFVIIKKISSDYLKIATRRVSSLVEELF